MKNDKLAALLPALSDAEINLMIDIYFSDFSWEEAKLKTPMSSEDFESTRRAFGDLFKFCGNPSREEIQGTLIAHVTDETDRFLTLLDKVKPRLNVQEELPDPSSAEFSKQYTELNGQVSDIYKKLYHTIEKFQNK